MKKWKYYEVEDYGDNGNFYLRDNGEEYQEWCGARSGWRDVDFDDYDWIFMGEHDETVTIITEAQFSKRDKKKSMYD